MAGEPFDPDAYLAKVDASRGGTAFDPDAYLAKVAPRVNEKPGAMSAFGRGGLQGVTSGFSDEMGGGVQAGLQGLSNLLPKGSLQWAGIENGYGDVPVSETYRAGRDDERRADADALAAHPEAFRGGELTGAVASSFAPGLGVAKGAGLLGTVGKMALLGGAQGLGTSEADLTKGQYGRATFDAGVGALFGAGAGAAGYGLQKLGGMASQSLLGRAANKTAAADAKAATLADKAVDAANATRRSAAGRAAQNAYKQVEHLRELGAVRNLSAAEAQELAALESELGGKAASNLLPAIADKNTTATEYAAGLASAATDKAAKKAEILTPTVAKSAREIFKSYGEPLIGAYVGNKLGEMTDHPQLGAGLGMMAGLIHGRTRGGKAILDRIAKPGNQIAIANGMEWLGNALGNRGADAARTANVVGRLPDAAGGAQQGLWSIPAIAKLFGGDSTEDRQRALADALRAGPAQYQ